MCTYSPQFLNKKQETIKITTKRWSKNHSFQKVGPGKHLTCLPAHHRHISFLFSSLKCFQFKLISEIWQNFNDNGRARPKVYRQFFLLRSNLNWRNNAKQITKHRTYKGLLPLSFASMRVWKQTTATYRKVSLNTAVTECCLFKYWGYPLVATAQESRREAAAQRSHVFAIGRGHGHSTSLQ